MKNSYDSYILPYNIHTPGNLTGAEVKQYSTNQITKSYIFPTLCLSNAEFSSSLTQVQNYDYLQTKDCIIRSTPDMKKEKLRKIMTKRFISISLLNASEVKQFSKITKYIFPTFCLSNAEFSSSLLQHLQTNFQQ